MKTLIVVATIALVATDADAKPPELTTRIAETQLAVWRCQDQLGWERTKASVTPWQLPTSTRYRQWVLNLWTLRQRECTGILREQKRQWNWQKWLPRHWYNVGSCETGYGGDPDWHFNSGTHQGAFGFANQSWDDFKLPGYPDEAYQASPWEQYQVALAIYNRYGMSGWGCKG